MTYQLIHGSAHNIPIPDKSVHSLICSPPYFGLRKYAGDQGIEWPTVEYSPMAGLAPIRVQGCEPGCDHEWADGKTVNVGRRDADTRNTWQYQAGIRPNIYQASSGGDTQTTQGAYCIHCGGWRGGLGLEVSIEAFIGHLILCLREWHRILRDDGTCWVNLGSSYNGSGGIGNIDGKQGTNKGSLDKRPTRINGLKPKDLILVMDRFANAAQADGWYIRSRPPWIKRNSMPESVTDRPSTSHEEWVMLAKSENYFWDIEAIKMPAKEWTGRAATFARNGAVSEHVLPGQTAAVHRADRTDTIDTSTGRNRRTGDWYYESLDIAISEIETWLNHAKQVRKTGGLLLDVDGDPAAFLVNPRPYKEAHFATFPQQMIEPIIRGATSAHGVCAKCGAPWRRVVERTQYRPEIVPNGYRNVDESRGDKTRKISGKEYNEQVQSKTTGWEPTCTCNCDEVTPAVVCDPFVGSGTSIRAAMKLGRNAIGVDISDEYLGDLVPERASNIQMELAL